MIPPLREWQKVALPCLENALRRGESGLVRACTGSGKTILLAALLLKKKPTRLGEVLVTAPTQRLVEQIALVLKKAGLSVGSFYSEEKRLRPIVVACHASLPTLIARWKTKGITPSVWVADECHLTEGPTLRAVRSEWRDVVCLGFTATPHRRLTSETLHIYPRVFVDYGLEEARKDGVIVPFRRVGWEGERLPLDEACARLIANAEGPGLANAVSIDDATDFAAYLRKRGIAAKEIHSRLDRGEQDKRIKDLQTGRLSCLVHVSLLAEGADFPWLRWLCLRRVGKNLTLSKNRFIQEIGRVLRVFPGKSEAVIYDPLDLFLTHKLSYPAAIGPSPYPEKKAPPSAQEGERDEEKRASWFVEGGASCYIRSLCLEFCQKVGQEAPFSPRRSDTAGERERYERFLWAKAAWERKDEIPPLHLAALSSLCQASFSSSFCRGDIEDLTCVFRLIARFGWPDLQTPPPISGEKKGEKEDGEGGQIGGGGVFV